VVSNLQNQPDGLAIANPAAVANPGSVTMTSSVVTRSAATLPSTSGGFLDTTNASGMPIALPYVGGLFNLGMSPSGTNASIVYGVSGSITAIGTSTTAATITVSIPSGLVTTSTNAATCSYSFGGDGYPIRKPAANPLQTQLTSLSPNVSGGGRYFRIPLAIPSQFFNQPRGLIPLHRLPKVRLEVTFNPAPYVLWSPNISNNYNSSATPVPFDTPALLSDYQLSNLRISAMYVQSPALAGVYDDGAWQYSYLGFSYQTVAVTGTSNLLSISMPFKSTRYIIGVFANPSQFSGLQGAVEPVDATTGATYHNTTSGGLRCAQAYAGTATGQNCTSDFTRWSNFYGLGGCYGGRGFGPDCSNPPLMGSDSQVCIPSAVNFTQNSEQLYQSDLAYRDQFWRELTKVWPKVKGSTFFNVTNFPGIRYVCAINLQTPELSDKFICGNKNTIGQSLGYLKFNTNTTDPQGGSSVVQSGCNFICWIAYDRVLRVEAGSGLCTVDY